jgi:hypothetical protein
MKKAKPAAFFTGVSGDDGTMTADPKKADIPVALQTQNRKHWPKPIAATVAATTENERTDWRKPKSLSWEQWDAIQNKAATEAAAKKEDGIATARANAAPRTPSLRKSNGMLDANYFGKVIGCEPKLVRRALRTTKAIPKPAFGWCFTEADAPKVIEVVKAWLANGKKKPVAGISGSGPATEKDAKAFLAEKRTPKTKEPPPATAPKADTVTKKAVDKMLAKLPAKTKKKK